VQSPTNLFKSMWKLVFNVINVILNLKVLKGKSIKYKWIMPYLKISKNMLLGKIVWKKINCNSCDLWKCDQIWTIQKPLTIKRLRFSNKRFFIWVHHLILHYILSPNNKFGIWIILFFSILWCSSEMTSPYFFTSKVHNY
jgi:hypothetical protein